MSESIDVHIFSTQNLHDRNGRTSEYTAGTYIVEALTRAGYDADVAHNFNIQDIDEHDLGHEETIREFQRRLDRNEIELQAEHCNLLLTDFSREGITYVNLGTSMAPAQHIDVRHDHRSWESRGMGEFHRNIHAVLHELGHSLGLPGPDEPGWGYAYTSGWWFWRKWHQTPCVTGNGEVNACGDYIVERNRNWPTVHHQTYHQCAADRFEV